MQRLKQKLRSTETKEAAYVAVGGLQRALDMFNKVAGDVGVPGLQKGVSGLSAVLAMIQVGAASRDSQRGCSHHGQKSHANTEAIKDLTKKVGDLATMVKESAELHGTDISPAMQARIDRLLSYVCHRRCKRHALHIT